MGEVGVEHSGLFAWAVAGLASAGAIRYIAAWRGALAHGQECILDTASVCTHDDLDTLFHRVMFDTQSVPPPLSPR